MFVKTRLTSEANLPKADKAFRIYDMADLDGMITVQEH